MRKFSVVKVLVLCLGVLLLGQASAQWAVIDGASITQSVTNTAKQIEWYKAQLEQLQNEYKSVTGSYGRGAQFLEQAVGASNFMPQTWQEVVAGQGGTVYSTASTKYTNTALLPDGTAIARITDTTYGGNYGMAAQAATGAMATNDTLYQEIQQHLENLQQLACLVDQTANVKDAADLHNRIAVEQAFVQLAQTRVQMAVNSTNANMLNQMLQGQAASARFFGVATPAGQSATQSAALTPNED